MLKEQPPVLVVEGDPDQAERYAAWLDEEYAVRTARDEHAALDAVGAADVDAVVLGTGLPAAASDAVLNALRERDLPTVAVTGADGGPDEPDVIDRRLDEPASAGGLRAAVSALVTRRVYSRGVQELFAVASERAALEADGRDDERRRELEARFDDLRERLDETLASLVESSGDVAAYRAVDVADDEDDDA